jgi:hypothetical protein
MSNIREFEDELRFADSMARLSGMSPYWTGYKRGLQRAYFGDECVDTAEHMSWLNLAASRDRCQQDRAKGYEDGLTALDRVPAAATRRAS